MLSAPLAQITEEVHACQHAFVMQFGYEIGLDPFRRVQIKSLGKLLDGHVAELRASGAEAKRELAGLGDKATAKRWLKQLREQQRQQELDDDDLYF